MSQVTQPARKLATPSASRAPVPVPYDVLHDLVPEITSLEELQLVYADE